MTRTGLVLLLLPVLAGNGCAPSLPPASEAASHASGKALLAAYGCASCHSIRGFDAARPGAGPPLDAIAGNSYVAGVLPNTTAAMVRWITHPRQVSPGTAMPELGVTEQQARAMAAYLSSQ